MKMIFEFDAELEVGLATYVLIPAMLSSDPRSLPWWISPVKHSEQDMTIQFLLWQFGLLKVKQVDKNEKQLGAGDNSSQRASEINL